MNIDINKIGYRWKGIYSPYLSYSENDVVYKAGGAYVIRNGVPVEFALGQQDAILKGHILTGGVSVGGFANTVLHSNGAGGVEFRFQDTKGGTLATGLMDTRTGRHGNYLTYAYNMQSIMSDGSVRTWGNQTNGLGGAGSQGDIGRTFPGRVAFPPGTPPITYVCGFWTDAFYLDASGTVWHSGTNHQNIGGRGGQDNIPGKINGLGDMPANAKIVKIRGASDYYDYRTVMFLDDQGRVYMTGNNQYNNHGMTGSSPYPRLVPFTVDTPIKEMFTSGGNYTATALISTEGQLWVCGQGGSTGYGVDISKHALWMPWGIDKPVKQVTYSESDAHWVAGNQYYRNFGVVLENGDLYVWGDVGGQTSCGWGVGYNSDIWTGSALHPYKVLTNVQEYGASSGGYPTLVALMKDGTVKVTGDSNYSVNPSSTQTWQTVGGSLLTNCTRLTFQSGQYAKTAGVLRSDGKVVIWGQDNTGMAGVGTAPSGRVPTDFVMLEQPIVDFQFTGWYNPAQTQSTAHFLTADGQVYSSGSGTYSVNGDDDNENTFVPRQILF